jgi:hypothetical protein
MNQNKLALFGKTKAMEAMIDNFLDKISEGGMRFEQGIASYVDKRDRGTPDRPGSPDACHGGRGPSAAPGHRDSSSIPKC